MYWNSRLIEYSYAALLESYPASRHIQCLSSPEMYVKEDEWNSVSSILLAVS